MKATKPAEEQKGRATDRTGGPPARRKTLRKSLLVVLLLACLGILLGCGSLQRNLLFFPTHHHQDGGLSAWTADGKTIGYCRAVPSPTNVWLMLYGNAGQAADRTYALARFAPGDAVYIMEYPGYGARDGSPSRAAFDAAAKEAYLALRRAFPRAPICVMGESIGSGPACALAAQSPPPDKIVLVVPFDTLASVASEHFPFLPVSLLLEAKWDNIRSLSQYHGTVEIFAAENDNIIPIAHARNLASTIASAKFHAIPQGHNDWSYQTTVEIRNP